jgi:ABC-type transporter Mla subunit MlaD
VLEKFPIVSIQRLFGLAVFLKLGLAALGYVFHQPIWLGTLAPLTVMVLYMFIGYHKRADDISEEKFADSCYYIGFIFTIASIIMCLFDVPKMAPGKGMLEIAVRFGSAMVSTVLGMIVRVYLVSFKKDASDAIKDIEAALLESTRAFTLQLADTVRNLQTFETQVIDSTKASVAGVQLQVEALGRNFSESLSEFYQQVNEENGAAFDDMVHEVEAATARLAQSADSYSGGMKGHLESIEIKVTQFADAVSARLKTTTFPDDFFAKQLLAPIEQFKAEASNLGESVRGVSDQVHASSGTLGDVLKVITTKTKKTQEAMGALVDLSEQHRILLENADLQLNAFGRLAQRLEDLDLSLKGVLEVVNTNSTASSELVTKVSCLSSDTEGLRSEIKESVMTLTGTLEANATIARGAIQTLETQGTDMRAEARAVVASLEQNAVSSERIVQHLAASVSELKLISGATMQASADSNRASGRASEAAEVAEEAVHRGREIAESLEQLGSTIRDQMGELNHVADKMRKSIEAQPLAIAAAAGNYFAIEGSAAEPKSGMSALMVPADHGIKRAAMSADSGEVGPASR